MPTITQNNPIAKLPGSELERSLREFVSPLTELLPDVRLGAVTELIVRGDVTQIARGASYAHETIWPTCQWRVSLSGQRAISFRTLRNHATESDRRDTSDAGPSGPHGHNRQSDATGRDPCPLCRMAVPISSARTVTWRGPSGSVGTCFPCENCALWPMRTWMTRRCLPKSRASRPSSSSAPVTTGVSRCTTRA